MLIAKTFYIKRSWRKFSSFSFESNKVNPDNMIVNQDTMTFKWDSVKVIKDYEGNDALEINYTFTMNYHTKCNT